MFYYLYTGYCIGMTIWKRSPKMKKKSTGSVKCLSITGRTRKTRFHLRHSKSTISHGVRCTDTPLKDQWIILPLTINTSSHATSDSSLPSLDNSPSSSTDNSPDQSDNESYVDVLPNGFASPILPSSDDEYFR